MKTAICGVPPEGLEVSVVSVSFCWNGLVRPGCSVNECVFNVRGLVDNVRPRLKFIVPELVV